MPANVEMHSQAMRPTTASKTARPNPVASTLVAVETGVGGGALVALGPLAGAGDVEEEPGMTSILTFMPPAQ